MAAAFGHRGMYRRLAGVPTTSYFRMEFDSIANAPVATPTSLADWQTFWSVNVIAINVVGDVVEFFTNGTAFTMANNKLRAADVGNHLVEFFDTDCFTSIGLNSIQNQTQLINAVFPAVASIGQAGFGGCTNLVNCSAAACTSVGNSAFASCSSLIEFVAPIVTSIGQTAFQDTTSLQQALHPLCTSLGSAAYRCTSTNTTLTTINFAALSSTVGTQHFLRRAGISGIITMNSLATIPSEFFSQCASITKFIGTSVTTIAGPAFTGCTLLTEVDAVNTTTFSGTGCFNNCTSLNVANYPNCTTLGTQTFRTIGAAPCPTLNLPLVVNVPSTLAFAGLTNLTTIHLDACTTLGSSTGNNNCFQGLTGKTIDFYIPVGTRTDGDVVFVNTNNTVTFFP